MPRKRTQITTEPEMKKLKRGGYSVRFRIPAHDGEPETKSPWRKYPEAKTKGLAMKAAEEYRQELEDELNDYTARADISFGDYARRWHEDRQDTGELNGLSYDREELLIRKIEAAKFAKIPLEDITEEDVDAFKKEIGRESKNEQSRLLKKVKQILRYAESRRRIKYDPSRVVKDIKANKKPRRSLTLEQQNNLMKALGEEPMDGEHAAILIALGTGLRRGEILGLMWKDYNPHKRCLTVERQLNAKGELVPPKYGSVGVIPLDDPTILWLNAWKKQVKHNFIGGVLRSDHTQTLEETPICCNGNCGFFLPSNFDRWRRRWFVEHELGTFESVETTRDAKGNVRKHYVGFKGYNLHELRHTAASELVASGADLQTVKTIMRHSRITTTEQYLHEVPDNMTEAVDRVSKRRMGYSKEAEEANAEQGLLDRNPHLKTFASSDTARIKAKGTRKREKER